MKLAAVQTRAPGEQGKSYRECASGHADTERHAGKTARKNALQFYKLWSFTKLCRNFKKGHFFYVSKVITSLATNSSDSLWSPDYIRSSRTIHLTPVFFSIFQALLRGIFRKCYFMHFKHISGNVLKRFRVFAKRSLNVQWGLQNGENFLSDVGGYVNLEKLKQD